MRHACTYSKFSCLISRTWLWDSQGLDLLRHTHTLCCWRMDLYPRLFSYFAPFNFPSPWKTPPPTYFTLGMVKFLLGPIRPDNPVCPRGTSSVSFTEERVYIKPRWWRTCNNVQLSTSPVWDDCVDTILFLGFDKNVSNFEWTTFKMKIQKSGRSMWQNRKRNILTSVTLSFSIFKKEHCKTPDKLLSGGPVQQIKIHLTNNPTERIITSHSMTFQAVFMPSAASLFCWQLRPTKGRGKRHESARQRNSKCIPLMHTALHNWPALQQQHRPLWPTGKACTLRGSEKKIRGCKYDVQANTRLGKFSTRTLTETQKSVLQDRPNSSNLFFQLKHSSCAQKMTETSMDAKQQSQMSNT